MQAWFLGNYAALGDDYDVMLLSKEPLALSFVPKSTTAVSKIISSVDMKFNQDLTYIDTMTVREAGGDTTAIQFISPRVNQPIADVVWEMPPNEH